MKKKKLQPQIIAPVTRTTKGNAAAPSSSSSVEASQYGGGSPRYFEFTYHPD